MFLVIYSILDAVLLVVHHRIFMVVSLFEARACLVFLGACMGCVDAHGNSHTFVYDVVNIEENITVSSLSINLFQKSDLTRDLGCRHRSLCLRRPS